MAVPKADVIQGLLSLYRNARYLEVGVAQGRTFHMVTAARKVAVDPKFRFNVAEAESSRPEASYHEVPSDSYFGGIVEAMRRCGCTLNNAYMQHSLLALVVIPELRISDIGLIDVTRFARTDLFVT